MMNNFWRIRISVLWIADVVALTAAFVLAMFEPGYLDELLIGQFEDVEINLGLLLLGSFFWLVPLFMMYLSLVLNRTVLRWLSIVLGLILALMNLFDFISQISSLEPLGIARAIMVAMMTIIPFVIVWHGLKWPPKIE